MREKAPAVADEMLTSDMAEGWDVLEKPEPVISWNPSMVDFVRIFPKKF